MPEKPVNESNKLPVELGYRMPAEWEPHEGTWISWPKDPETFPEKVLGGVEDAYASMVRELQKGEKVFILVDNAEHEREVREKLSKKGVGSANIIFHRIKSVDVWTRDYAPIFVKNADGEVAATKWIFNAWGDKYEELKYDNIAGGEIAKLLVSGKKVKEVFETNIVFEGGAIDTNGKWVFLTTEQCLLNKKRNPQLGKTDIERYLHDYLGAKTVIWLKQGIAGDDTDGHVDDFARFVNENTVVCAFEENPADENYKPLKENFEFIKKSGLNVIPLPMPEEISVPERRLPASYANFYIANKVVLMPAFNQKTDAKAQSMLQKFFPDRKVVPIQARDLVYGYGGIHCVTMQQPK